MVNSKKTVAIYARVSTDKQKVDMQLRELEAFVKRSGWQIYRKYIDQGYTGANINRPAFIEMKAAARKRNFNILLVWKLDRLSRSLKDLINTLDELGSLGIDFISYENNLDTSTPTGKLVFQIIGAVAEFEKDIIRERVIAGLNNARSKGKRLGRPGVPEKILGKAKALRDQGLSFRKIGKKLGIDEGVIRKRMNEKNFKKVLVDKDQAGAQLSQVIAEVGKRNQNISGEEVGKNVSEALKIIRSKGVSSRNGKNRTPRSLS